jgi:DNA-binding GntR family transcriptional regulator
MLPTLSAAAYLTIRDKILAGEYPPGTPVTRRRLAEELGLSLIPITDALKRLELDGLTESLPRIGTRVKIPRPDEIVGHYQLREALETQSARLFAERATTRQKKVLIKQARNLDSLYESFSRAGSDWRHRLFLLHKAHADFHMDIAGASKCKPLLEAMERSHIIIFNWLYNSAAHQDALPARWHEDLMEALTTGDPEIADKAMRRHTRFAMSEIVERLSSQHGSFPMPLSFRGPQKKTMGAALQKRLRSAKVRVSRHTDGSPLPKKAFGVDW